MSETKITVRDHGPLIVEGAVTVLDGEGKPLPIDTSKPAVALCRCGASANKPFCDGAHRSSGFDSAVRAGDG